MIQIKDLDFFEQTYIRKNNLRDALLFILPIPPHFSRMIAGPQRFANSKQSNSDPRKDDSLVLSESVALDASIFTLKNSHFKMSPNGYSNPGPDG